MKLPKINIIFRACDKVNAVNKQLRPFGLSKGELIKICFQSMYKSIQPFPHTIIVLGDKLSEDMMSFFSAYNVELSNGDYGNDESIRQSIYAALKFTNDKEWIYFCEDDYLHRPETFLYISNLIKEKEKIALGKRKIGILSSMIYSKQPNIVIFPPDYPDRYLPEDRCQHYIFHTEDCYWRQVANTTFTFLMQLKDVKKFSPVLLKSANKANDGFLSKKIFGKQNFNEKLLCVSPMPGLTTHMHINTLTPLVDWKNIADTLATEINKR